MEKNKVREYFTELMGQNMKENFSKILFMVKKNLILLILKKKFIIMNKN